MKILDIPQSGRCGTFVSLRTRYGQVRRRYAVSRKSPSPAQIVARAIFGRIRALWRTLTDAQRATWTTGNQDTNSQPRLGKSGCLTGYLLFMKVNATLAYQGLDLVFTPPERPKFDANPVVGLVVTNTAGAIDLKLSVPSAPVTDILVLGTHLAARASRSPSISSSSAAYLPSKRATAISPSSTLTGSARLRPARGSSSAPGRSATAGEIFPSRPPPSSPSRNPGWCPRSSGIVPA